MFSLVQVSKRTEYKTLPDSGQIFLLFLFYTTPLNFLNFHFTVEHRVMVGEFFAVTIFLKLCLQFLQLQLQNLGHALIQSSVE